MSGSNALQITDPNDYSDNPLYSGTPSQGEALGSTVSTTVDRLGQWLAEQRAKSSQMGLWNDRTNMPTSAGLVNAAQQYGNALMMGTTAPGITAYHGSPYSFDRFDTSKIGTGEGAQAYGHGLYFAENEGVAQGYRDQLAGKGNSFEWNGQVVPPGKPAFDLVDALGEQDWRLGKIAEQAAKYGPRNAIETFEPHTRNASDGPAWQAAMDQFKQGAGSSATGKMYEVNIQANPEHFLDWDKPLSEQSQHVQDALKGWNASRPADQQLPSRVFGPRQAGQSPQSNLVEPSGQSIYQHFSSTGGNDPAAGAKALQDAGISGIRYLDAGSRGAGQGSSNYVVFDAKTIDILRKYGIAGLLMGASAAAGSQQQ